MPEPEVYTRHVRLFAAGTTLHERKAVRQKRVQTVGTVSKRIQTGELNKQWIKRKAQGSLTFLKISWSQML